MTPERLIPVRSESELRVGMIVVSRPCLNCGTAHRFILIASVFGMFRDVDTGKTDKHRSWHRLPDPPCANYEYFNPSHAIATGRLFRVEDGLEQQTNATKRKRELAK